MLRTALLAAARSPLARQAVERTPLAKPVVRRFVAGSSLGEAVAVTASLIGDGRKVTLDHLGEDTMDAAQAAATVHAYERLLAELGDTGLSAGAEVSVKLSAVGQSLPKDGEKIALDNARLIGEAAAAVGTTVTLDMEDHTTTDSTLGILADLRVDFPSTGAVLQAYLRRTEQDCRDLSGAGSRVRLCKGAYKEPETVAYQDKSEVDRSYVRCLKILMAGDGYPMVASHDPRLVSIAADLADAAGRTPDTYEHQMLYGVRPDAQRQIAAAGKTLRVYVPYGDQWYGYFMRRLAERPANVAFFLRSLATKS
ncbi:proline dehydrogenase family protein [Kutzneria sp. CA-103260]|uniref:proline dehydrogenase family protein n=1 Tax=Kutzneria sp. CA-103260 TaxID=2802641 RepID=UPI001BAA126B|nr:proline dehydrogenase family protein [Kutzneria sp. CA-103260]QUQ66433.1 proline dehydrogenase [Kutzneria sp. CA-103260]